MPRRKKLPGFSFGQVVATPAALDALSAAGTSPLPYLARHAREDWGSLDSEDVQANNDALVNGDRLLSAYILPSGEKIWIITEADRSSTCVLLPSDY